jgi:UDP-galactopyranose mutase
MYDLLLVGCGLFNASFARCAMDMGRRVLIIDRRNHIGGNCYDESVHGINVHKYGPHQFHTKSRAVWDFVNRFAKFNHYRAHIKANYRGRVFSMPPNMMLYHQLWGVTTPDEAQAKIEESRIPCTHPKNLKEMICDAVGEQIYDCFYFGYSSKMWGVDPSEIPVSVGKRLPIRFTWHDRWFDDEFEGIPKGGYTKMIANMIDGASVMLNIDYLEDRASLDKLAHKVVFTGRIDELFENKFGDLEYRSLRFEQDILSGDYQGNAIINFTDRAVPYTRITEHKHFEFTKSDRTVITKEYPQAYVPNTGTEPYYPIDNEMNRALYERYFDEWRETCPNMLGGGRLFSFKYYDMDQVVASAMALARREVGWSDRSQERYFPSANRGVFEGINPSGVASPS